MHTQCRRALATGGPGDDVPITEQLKQAATKVCITLFVSYLPFVAESCTLASAECSGLTGPVLHGWSLGLP